MERPFLATELACLMQVQQKAKTLATIIDSDAEENRVIWEAHTKRHPRIRGIGNMIIIGTAGHLMGSSMRDLDQLFREPSVKPAKGYEMFFDESEMMMSRFSGKDLIIGLTRDTRSKIYEIPELYPTGYYEPKEPFIRVNAKHPHRTPIQKKERNRLDKRELTRLRKKKGKKK